MGGFVVYSDTIGLIICLAALLTASVVTVDPFACTPKKAGQKPNELVLNCNKDPGLVVTGFIRGGHVKQLPSSKKPNQPVATEPDECPVPDNKTACWANPINGHLLSVIQECVWKNPTCKIPVSGQMLGYPCFARPATYIFADQFKCIKKSRIVHLCSSPDKDPQLSVRPSDGETFILSKGYPELVAPNLTCTLTIKTDAMGLRFESIYMHMHPKRRGQQTCDVDYLDIRPAAAGSKDAVRFCGREEIDHTSSVASTVQFVSGRVRKHYGGFVVKVTAFPASNSQQDKKAPEEVINSAEFKTVKNSAAARPSKNTKANEARSKNSTRQKS